MTEPVLAGDPQFCTSMTRKEMVLQNSPWPCAIQAFLDLEVSQNNGSRSLTVSTGGIARRWPVYSSAIIGR
jgi:hypothetical protein